VKKSPQACKRCEVKVTPGAAYQVESHGNVYSPFCVECYGEMQMCTCDLDSSACYKHGDQEQSLCIHCWDFYPVSEMKPGGKVCSSCDQTEVVVAKGGLIKSGNVMLIPHEDSGYAVISPGQFVVSPPTFNTVSAEWDQSMLMEKLQTTTKALTFTYDAEDLSPKVIKLVMGGDVPVPDVPPKHSCEGVTHEGKSEDCRINCCIALRAEQKMQEAKKAEQFAKAAQLAKKMQKASESLGNAVGSAGGATGKFQFLSSAAKFNEQYFLDKKNENWLKGSWTAS